ncbi:hypothetical protein THSYN_19090 [Candidatus Thiodictyon syntrophicum]|uniref:Uncharacterized protein n=1 Tax=Candidatus Thiodictyon syntrophicum TaxID=1166950 RepID=A0A2K8UB77_9GAMM|nr:hypothetical protein THSYN_19090 [Candidatus Thiodictyon syntrophicum]
MPANQLRHGPLQGAELFVAVQHLERLDGDVTLERIGTLGQGLAAGLSVLVQACRSIARSDGLRVAPGPV